MPGQLTPLVLALVVGLIIYLVVSSLVWAVVIGLLVFVVNAYWIGRTP